MMKTLFLPCLMSVALAVSGAAFAATASAPTTTAPATVKMSVSQEKVNEISKKCFAEHKNDKAAYKTCFHDKMKAAENETTAK